MRTILIFVVRVYRLALSPFLGQHCRFSPTCSEYAEQSIRRFGVLRGSAMALRRLSCCHPWHAGGWDPVPESSKHKSKKT